MNYKKLLVWIEKFLKLSDAENIVLKTWIYRDNVLVIDCLYKGSKFAFDIKIGEKGLLDLFLVDRNDNVVFLYKGVFASKVKLVNKIKLKELGKALSDSILGVQECLNQSYKYDVSVVVPVYNREKIIKKCVESLNNQTLDKQNFEVIFVDDCSTDQSVKSIHELVDSSLNYRVLSRVVGSGNASAPRNEGIKSSDSKYVLFIDSDDYLSSHCLENALNLAEENASDLVYLKMGSDDEFPRNVPTRSYKNGTIRKANVSDHHLLRSNAMCKLYKKSFLLRESLLLNPSISVAEDRLFSISVLSKTKKVSILADDVYIYVTRHDGEHLTHKHTDLDVELYLYLDGFNRIFLSKHDFDYRNQLYNAWMILVIERLRGVLRSKRYSETVKYNFFRKILMYCNWGPYSLDKKYIYKELHCLLDAVVDCNYLSFCNINIK